MKKCIGYTRVSTGKQELSPAAQVKRIQEFADRHGLEVASIFSDTCSGAAPLEERSGLIQALAELNDGDYEHLVVAKRDRLARDMLVSAGVERLVERAGATIRTADGVGNEDSPEGQLLRSMIDAFAQYERALIRLRTTAALAVNRAHGRRWCRHPPYGYAWDDDGRVVRNEVEQDAIAAAVALRASGKSYRAIAERLSAEGFEPRGDAWYPTTVKRLLTYDEQVGDL